jgi:RHS repeat-associated protein
VPYDNVTGLGSYGWRVGASGDGQPAISAPNVKVPKNGYAFVYLSNESKTPVYFDDFTVTHVRGRIIEENVYDPYGLKIKGISAKAIDKGDNKYGYQGEFEEDEEETGWDEFDLRMYDPQIGRWVGVDCYDEFPSSYISMGNNPVNLIDPDGGGVAGTIGMAIGSISFAALMNWGINEFNGNQEKNGRDFRIGTFERIVLDLGAAYLGASVGYATGEALNGENWINSFKAFTAGFWGTRPVGDEVGAGKQKISCGWDNTAIVPNLWGWLPHIELPNLRPTIPILTDIPLDIYFHVNEDRLHAERNRSSDINQQIRRIQRTLKQNPGTGLVVTGGVLGDGNGLVGFHKDKGGTNEFYGRTANELGRARAERAVKYIQRHLRRKFRKRVSTSGDVIPHQPPPVPKAIGRIM